MKYPYQKFTLNNLPNELWRDIEGYEGIVQISDFGRIKSLQRTIFVKQVNREFYKTLPEKILRQDVTYNTNQLKGDRIGSLRTTWHTEGCLIRRSITRLVYHHFVSDLGSTQVVINKDGDWQNNHFLNLDAISKSQLRSRSFALGRDQGNHHNGKARYTMSIPVKQLSADGEVVATFKSLSHAQRETGFLADEISRCVRGLREKYHGYRWVRHR